MLIDIHVHAAGGYNIGNPIKSMAANYDFEKIILCTSSQKQLKSSGAAEYARKDTKFKIEV